jgi:hypothetical protein
MDSSKHLWNFLKDVADPLSGKFDFEKDGVTYALSTDLETATDAASL